MGCQCYEVYNGRAEIVSADLGENGAAINASTHGALKIPSRLGGFPVTGIGEEAFSECSGLTRVTIPEGVTSIGESAFEKCDLTCVTLPNNLTKIEESAFEDCDGLISVTLPDSLRSIGWTVFAGCVGLTSVTIPDGVTDIGLGAFMSCRGLTSVTIPESVTNIGESAFSGCVGLTSVTIPERVTGIGGRALFCGCRGLADAGGFVIVNGVLYHYCGEAAEAVIPDGVTRIADCVFGDYTYGVACNGLTRVVIPDGVMDISCCAFYNCPNLKAIEAKVSNPNYCSVDGVLYDKDMTEIVRCPAGKVGDFRIPLGVTNIGGCAFSGCVGLTSVTIPEGVANIGGAAFQDCGDLECVTIRGHVASFGGGGYPFPGSLALKVVYVQPGDRDWVAARFGVDVSAIIRELDCERRADKS